MLELTLEPTELFDNDKQEFIQTKGVTLRLEHSLVSLSKWEAKYHKPYLDKMSKTVEESKYYIKCMNMTQNVADIEYEGLRNEHIQRINAYIEDEHSATKIPSTRKEGQSPNHEIITSELIYFWMFSYGIPKECEKWHLNRLLKLIEVFGYKNTPKKKRSQKDLAGHYAALNKARRAKSHSKG